MNFITPNLNKCAARIGFLNAVDNIFQVETPLPMFYTRGGSIPHITQEIFKIVSKTPQIVQIPLVSTHCFEEAFSVYPGNFIEYVGLQGCLSCVTVQDPAELTQTGHHQKDHIPIWTRAGKVLVNSEIYMNIVEKFKPDMYYILSDGDTNIMSSSKRLNNAVEKTLTLYKQCLQRHKSSELLKNCFVMAGIAGGYSLKARKHCIDQMDDKHLINGFLIDGLHNNGPEVEFMAFGEVKPVVEYVIENLPATKIRSVQGCWNALNIIKLVKLGIDLFDTSYCHIVTERSSALTFSLDPNKESRPYEINLRQPYYSDDFEPILPGCCCLSCTNHTKSYIHHLIMVQELLGQLLLTIHNMHHYLKFFESIRECIKRGTLDYLEGRIEIEFNRYEEQLTKFKKHIQI